MQLSVVFLPLGSSWSQIAEWVPQDENGLMLTIPQGLQGLQKPQEQEK